MALLKQSDYKTVIQDRHLMELIDGDLEILSSAELTARKRIEKYLRTRYQTGVIFDDLDSYPDIKQYLIDLTIYEVLASVTPKHIPQIRIDRYMDAMAEIKAASNNEISPEWPEHEYDDGTTGGQGPVITSKKDREQGGWYY